MFQTVLAVIIIVNLQGVFAQVKDVPKLWNTDRLDLVRANFILTQRTQNPVPCRPLIQGCFLCVCFPLRLQVVWVVTLFSALVFNLDLGLGIAIVFSLFTIIFRTQQ